MRLTRATNLEQIGQHGPSVAALAMTGGGATSSDHLHLYEALFGRDSLRVAMSLMDITPRLARATVLELARHQGTIYHTAREEEPGRIAHEIRDRNDPVAIKLTSSRGWDWPYYGSVDATPEFIRTLATYCNTTKDYAFLNQSYTDRSGRVRTITHALLAALEWIERRMNSNTEGLLEYKTPLPCGIENQVWKDSWDSYSRPDGTLANHKKGIASIEVQVAVYDALIDSAELMETALDMPSRAHDLRLRAETLRATILSTFWTNDKGGYFILGVDRDDNDRLRPLKIRTSNMGHVLNSRLLESGEPACTHKTKALVQQLFSPEMLSTAGVRTLASDEARYRPGSYQNGSVWPWDTHYIAIGLRRHGYIKEANMLDQRVLGTVSATNMLPEYVRGDDTAEINTAIITVFDKKLNRFNLVEQPPQEVQAWTAAAVLEIETRRSARTHAYTEPEPQLILQPSFA